MKRREFLVAAAGAGVASSFAPFAFAQEGHDEHTLCHPTYATPADAMKAPPEKYAFVPAILVGTKTKRPDYMATVDIDSESPTFGKVVGRFDMPIVGDELHHYGWNACSSCHGERHRRYLVVPGLASGNIYIIDAADPKNLKMHKQISGKDIASKTNLSTPHTVHCLADGTMMISMLGDSDGNAPGGFLLIDESFEIKGRWEKDASAMKFNYDFWYQPGINAMVSSEWAAPNTVAQGFKLEDVKAGKYGQQLHFWDWKERKIEQTVELGEKGMIPLEVRFHHDPSSSHGFVGAALSSVIWHWQKKDKWVAEPIVEVEPVETEGWPFPVPGLITDLVLSLDDKFLYFANWLHGDIRQYDVSDPANPKLTGQVWLGGVIGHKSDMKTPMTGGPQMLQLSKDGKRLFVTSSLYSVWDNQFYPKMAEEGSWMAMIDCDTQSGGMKLNNDFLVDFGKEPYGPARAHEIRFPDGDSTSDIWELAADEKKNEVKFGRVRFTPPDGWQMRKGSLGQGIVLYAPMRDQWRDIGYRPNIGVRIRPIAGLAIDKLQADLNKMLEQSAEKLNEDAKSEIRRVNEELSKKIQLEDKGEFSLTREQLDGDAILISRFDGKHRIPKGSLLTRTRGIQIPDAKGLYSVSFTFPLENAEEMEGVWEAFQSQLHLDVK